jgi:DNA-binding HxlR family transcriptional regulator
MGAEVPVNGNGGAPRAGTRALALLAAPISGLVLRALASGPKRLIDLRRDCGSPAQTTLRAYLRELEEVDAIDRRRGDTFPGAIECELTPAGEELLLVLATVEQWLREAPEGPLNFGGPAAKAAITSLVEAWSCAMMRALAARPLSLTELDGVISGLSYPALERRLAAMKLAGQVRPCDGEGKGTPYAPTSWLREGTAPLAAAALWERRHLPDRSPGITRMDVEAAFLLTLPLLGAPPDLSGTCRLGVEIRNNGDRRLVGAMATVEEGRVASYSIRLDSDADAWATGSTNAWLHAVIAADTEGLELGGEQRLARTLLEGLHEVLFGAAPTAEALSA